MKILVIHVSAGAGHTKAAEAIYNGIKQSTSFEAVFADALDYTYPFYKTAYRNSYTFLVSKWPWLWGFFFNLTDVSFLRGFVRLSRRILNFFNAKSLMRFLIQEKFDYIISTHFFPIEVAAFLKRKGLIQSKIVSVITDFDVHSIWLAQGVDWYTVACEYTKGRISHLGVEPEKVVISGIPTDGKFSQPQDKNALRAKFGIAQDAFTVLIATGSFGFGVIASIVEMFDRYQVMVICGNNRQLFEKLNKRNLKFAKIYGLVNNMHEFMAVCDCMVTKPGGLSISEALINGLPLIFFSAIPGQEVHNVRVLRSYGIGILHHDLSKIKEEVNRLSQSRDHFIKTQQNIQQLARPFAVKDIIRLIS